MKKSTPVKLSPVVLSNWKECISLNVHPDQKTYVPSNVYSIAEAQFYPDACPLAVYNSQQKMVGFIMYGRDHISGKWKLFRLMIDAHYQSQGYGKAATIEVLERLKQKPDCKEVIVCYWKANTIAKKLYAELGFVEQSCDSEVYTAIITFPDKSFSNT